MQRREVLVGATVGILAASLPRAAIAASAPTRVFEVTTDIELPAGTGPAALWLPMFQGTAYQQVLNAEWQGSGEVQAVRDAATGADVLHARWSDSSTPRRVTLTTKLTTQDRSTGNAPGKLDRAARERWTRPLPGTSENGIVRETALRIVGDRREPRAQLRAIYDWVVANTWREASTAGCGRGDIEGMLRTGNLGGKCVDLNRLMVGLSRAVGIPARDVYGVRLAASGRFASLGRSGDVTKAQHCRAEAWLDGEGWLALDPADVRKAVLEEKLAIDSAPIKALTESLFGGWEGNWGAYNDASGIVLPGGAEAARFDFLMYPAAVVSGEARDCLAPDTFVYRIASRELSA